MHQHVRWGLEPVVDWHWLAWARYVLHHGKTCSCGGGIGNLSRGRLHSGFLPTQQLLIWVRGWETLSAVTLPLGASSLPLPHSQEGQLEAGPSPIPGLEVPQVSGWATLLAATPVPWMCSPRDQARPEHAGPGRSVGLPCRAWPWLM